MEDFIKAYLKTDYHVFKLNTIIRIGKTNKIIDSYLTVKNKNSFAFITAWNPQSKTLTSEENIKLNSKTKISKDLISKFKYGKLNINATSK